MTVQIKKPYDAHERVTQDSGDDIGRTKQADRESCDINMMIEKFQRSGIVPAQNALPPRYGDFSQHMDLHSSINAVNAAEDVFFDLPAKLREQFDNDPVKLVEFVDNPDNQVEAEELGLLPRKTPAEPPPPAPGPPADPPAPGDPPE